MGVSQSLCVDCVEREKEQDQLDSTMSKSQVLMRFKVKSDPYEISPQADLTYKKLMEKHNNEYLDVRPTREVELDLSVEVLEGYYKLPLYDAFYHGEWRSFQPHGRGIARLPNGSMFIGTFINGYCEGNRSYYIYADGSYYVGSIINNTINGKGKYLNKNVEYSGNWVNNVPNGEGIESYPNGDRYIGLFQNGLKSGTDSLFVWNNHESYIQYKGSFKQGKICGQGRLTLRNKRIVEGLFEEQAILNCVYTSSKYKYTGDYKNGYPTGYGTIQLSEIQQTYEGNFEQCKLYGHCIIKDEKERASYAYFFKGKQLKTVNGLSQSEIEGIIQTVQTCYQSFQKHSDAIAQLSSDLDSYEIRLVQPFENIYSEKYLVVDIYEKMLLIKSKSC